MNKRLLMSLTIVLSTLGAVAQQKVKDGTVANGSLPNRDALLELESNNKGLLHARVALVESINPAPLSAHVAGMMVYNTATSKDLIPGIYYNDGTKWVFVKGTKGDPGSIIIEAQPGKTGTPGIPGQQGGPGAGTTIVTNDSGTWIYNPTTNTWTNVNGASGKNGVDGKSITSGTAAPSGGNNGDTYVNTTTGDVYTNVNGTWTVTGNIKGPAGAVGATGPAGAAGANGVDGKSITGGAGAPGAGTGNNGDTYVNTTTGDVYTNVNGTWTVTGNIKGAKGDNGIDGKNGVDGKSITSGTGVPTGGNNGDTYVNTTTGDVYTNVNGTWTVTGNIKGAKGDNGIDGKNGVDGKSITSGTGVPTGGNNGDTYVNTTTGDVYTNVNGTWTVTGNIKGAKGDNGIDGKNGVDGKSITSGTGVPTGGNNGDTYVNTTTGDVYTNVNGTWTVTGNIKGAKGDNGIDGKNGVDGKSITSGTGVPTGGNNGDTYVNTTTGDVYTNVNGTWTVTGNIKGPAGAAGATGPAGAAGTNGVDGKSITSGTGVPTGGNNGDTYVNTTTGDVYTNVNGTWTVTGNIKGPAGAAGATGPAGAAGTNGVDGKSITSGTGVPTGGNNGDTYVNTTTGDVYTNVNGTWTVTGNIKGPAGAAGATGPAGAAGTNGVDGKSITSGTGVPTGGNNGDTYVNTTTGDVYTNVNGTWTVTGNIKGPKGDAGVAGPVGPQGQGGLLENGLNTTVTGGGVTGNAYKVNVATATATTLGVVKPGTGLTIDGTGTISVTPAAQANTTLAFNSTTSILTYTNEQADNPTIDLTPLKVEPWQIQTTTNKATANGDNIYQIGSVAVGVNTIPTITVGAVTVNPKFHVAGDISTTGKIYTTNSVYADYVFDYYFDGFSKIYDKYKFKSLKEVAEFIKANKHLPGVTPIKDITKTENGYTLDLTQLSMQQLEKLEELYLHVIEINTKMTEKDEEIKVLQGRTKSLEDRLIRLEQLINKK